MDQLSPTPRRRGRPSKAQVQEQALEPPKPVKMLVVAVVGAYPINCYPLKKVVYPNSEVELEDHPWVRKQIKLGSLRLIG